MCPLYADTVAQKTAEQRSRAQESIKRSPTFRLAFGLSITLISVVGYAGYSISQLRSLRDIQSVNLDRNRLDTHRLLLLQDRFYFLSRAIHGLLESSTAPSILEWEPDYRHLRSEIESGFNPRDGYSARRTLLDGHYRSLWVELEKSFELARTGNETAAREQLRQTLQLREASICSETTRLLLESNQGEGKTENSTRLIYDQFLRNSAIFAVGIVSVIGLTSIWLVQFNRTLFGQIVALSKRRGELVRQLISMQENTYRSISRELHDEFGQILTAIGMMLNRADRKAGDLHEVRELVQATLEKVRSLSYALHPVILTEVGLESALDLYITSFGKRTGIEVSYERPIETRQLDATIATHLYRVVQEALNNVAKHSRSRLVAVTLCFPENSVVIEIRDEGIGFGNVEKVGLGLVSMRERVELVDGTVEFISADPGAVVRVTVPIVAGGSADV